jgi:hypothetical protein
MKTDVVGFVKRKGFSNICKTISFENVASPSWQMACNKEKVLTQFLRQEVDITTGLLQQST